MRFGQPRPILRLLVLAIVIGSLLRDNSTTFAHGRPYPLPRWFACHVATIPAEQELGFHWESAHNRIQITNATSIPLYILEYASPPTTFATALPISPPTGMGTRYKIAQNHVDYWDEITAVWKPASTVQAFVFTLPTLPELYHEGELWTLSHDFHIAWDEGVDRPDDVIVPTAQRGQIAVMYGSTIQYIPIILTHERNPTYAQEVEAYRAHEAEAARWGVVFYISVALYIGVLVLGAIGVVVGVFWGLRAMTRFVRKR